MDRVMFSIVIPAYNEESVIDECHRRLTQTLRAMGEPYELIFVNDGSRDHTVERIEALCDRDPCVKLVSLSRNHGHQLAVSAGLDHAAGEAIVIIDADLQDPPEIIPEMVKLWKEGYDVVYGKRKKRPEGERFFKRVTAYGFYRLLNAMTDCPIPVDTGDFRLVSRKAADAVRAMPEHNRYLRGMFSWIGFKQTPIEFDRDKRFSGETKYTLKKMLQLAGNGIFSFSSKPLSLIGLSGVAFGALGVLWLLILLICLLCGVRGLGLSALAALLVLCTGCILAAMGTVGTYVGRIYEEAKGRPLYLISKTKGFEK
ncbi:MAG TPA: glycosyltransferase family 2 protein [Clostridia bacterium]|nr:glycosyltransferase family 2 protein [Clostridia bacterium]